MAKLEVNIRTLEGTHINSKISECDLNIPMDWEMESINWYRFYGNKPKNLEYRITASKILEANLDGVWTPVGWTSSTSVKPARLTFDHRKASGEWVEGYFHMTNEQLHETTLHPFYGTTHGWDTLEFAENNALYRMTFERHMQRKAKEYPVIPPMSDERRAGLLEKARIGFEESWELFHNQRRRELRGHVQKWAERMMNLGYEGDPREDPKYLTELPPVEPVERLKVDWFTHNGAVFLGSKEKIDEEHIQQKKDGWCECYACDHDQERYEKDDSCNCDECCNNLGHWNRNRRNPDHCDFCHEFAEHLADHAPDTLEKREEDKDED